MAVSTLNMTPYFPGYPFQGELIGSGFINKQKDLS